MTVDPVDDCTFWYTQEYIQSTGSFNWNSRIANLSFPNCNSSAMATLSPAKLSFPKTPIGQTASLNVTLTNTGTSTLNISDASVTGSYSVQSNTCGTQVTAGNNCTFTIGFTPTAQGTQTGTFQLADNAVNNPQQASLTGVGVSLSLSPTTLNFGPDPVGQVTGPQTVTVTNVGTATVNLTNFTITGTATDYAISANSCGATLAAGTNCAISVTFDPIRKGVRNGKLNILNSGGGTVTEILSGTGQ